MLQLVPIDLATVKRYVARHHRHNSSHIIWKFGVGVEANGTIVGVAAAGRPKGRGLDEPRNIEAIRVCTDGTRNANSMLYGSVARAAQALGYWDIYTYTLEGESGASLRAAGYEVDAVLRARGSWTTPSRPRYERDLFGVEQTPTEAKVRWVRHLSPFCAHRTDPAAKCEGGDAA